MNRPHPTGTKPTAPIPPHATHRDRLEPERLVIAAVIAQAVGDYRGLLKRRIVSHFGPNRSHRIWSQTLPAPNGGRSRTDSNNLNAVYCVRSTVNDLLAFFRDGGGLDQWCEMACLQLNAQAVRAQLNAEEDGRKRTPDESVFLTIVSETN